MTAISCLNLAADSAPSVKQLTPQQCAQRNRDYERFKRYVQSTMYQQQSQVYAARAARLKQKAKNHTPNPPKVPYKHAPIPRDQILLVMPAKGAKTEDIKDTIESNNGQICGRLGAGGLGVILVKARPGKVIELQRALAADTRDFKHVDFNRRSQSQFVPGSEPSMPKAWHLIRMQITDAWDELYKNGMPFPKLVAVFDTGSQGPEPFLVSQGADCTGSIENDAIDDLGFDFDGVLGTGLFDDSIKDQENDIIHIGNYIKTMTYGVTDPNGHGTWVASAVNGSPYNGMGAAGVNPQAAVYPIRIAGNDGFTDDLALVKAMCVQYDNLNTPVINISYGPDLMRAGEHEILHEFFKDWYYRKNGLVFVSAGNGDENQTCANQPYVNAVSAMGKVADMKLAVGKKWKSAHGTAIDFTAPGQYIQVCNQDGTAKSASGTSLSCPLVAGVASLIWTMNPNLKNTEVEKILRDSCDNTDGANTWNESFGWGMPNALKAVKAAQATVPRK